MFSKETLLNLQSHSDAHTHIGEDFNTSFSSMNKLPRPKLNIEILDIKEITNQTDIVHIYISPKQKEYAFYSKPSRTFSNN